MTTNTLSGVARDIIATYARTATHVLQSYERGSERLATRVNERWKSGVTQRAARLSPELRGDIVNAEIEIAGLFARGAATLSNAAQEALGAAERVVVAGVDRVAGAIARFEPVVGAQTAQSLRVVTMPSARALADLTHGLAKQTVKLTDRAFGLTADETSSVPAVVKRTASRKTARRAN
ncbi:MAG TPA: hypothetical protein VFR86_03730 [Burkholderiaceae bacterium]|nr:hypothetical protein [Burkholderiaceae bacterium]